MWGWVVEFLYKPMPELNSSEQVVFWVVLALMSALIWAMGTPRR